MGRDLLGAEVVGNVPLQPLRGPAGGVHDVAVACGGGGGRRRERWGWGGGKRVGWGKGYALQTVAPSLPKRVELKDNSNE